MAKQLNIDEMLDAARLAKMPGAEKFVAAVEGLANDLAQELAEHLGVDCGAATFEGVAFAGTCAPFYAKTPDQVCPEALRDFDATEWRTEEGEEAPRAETEKVEA